MLIIIICKFFSLQKAVEEEYRKWKSMSNENDIIAHFSLQHNTSPLFLCLLFKMVLDTDRVPNIAYKYDFWNY